MIPFALTSALLLSACSAQDPEPPGEDTSVGGEAMSVDGGPDVSDVFDRIGSCDTVATHVAPYIEGLVPLETNAVDEYGAYCQWEAPEGIADLGDLASVEVSIVPSETSEVEDPDIIEQAGLTLIPDDALDAAGGIAYGLDGETAVAAVTVTSVRVPGINIDITGGQWGDRPALDGPAAVGVAKGILGIG